MNALPRIVLLLAVLLLVAGVSATAVRADEAPPAGAEDAAAAPETPEGDAADAAPEKPPTLGQLLVGIVVGLLLVAGIGSLIGLLRVIFAGPARAADAAVQRLHTGRLLLTGVLPLVGAGLLGVAAEATGSEAVQIVWGVVIGLPVMVLIAVGALAAIPHLGSRLLARGRESERSLLARCIGGALVLILALGPLVWGVKQIAPVVGVLVAAWFLGTGLGTIFRPRTSPENGIDA